MALGIETFGEWFKDYKDQYVIIGGMACDLLMEDVGLDFRLTKDVDMVLIIDALTEEFAHRFWGFIEEGGYTARKKTTGKSEFYRFVEPQKAGFPLMIELFARPENAVDFEYKGHLVPIHLGDEISSLSAILLNDEYYQFILNGRTVIDDVVILDAAHIVPLRMNYIRRSRSNETEHHLESKTKSVIKSVISNLRIAQSLLNSRSPVIPRAVRKRRRFRLLLRLAVTYSFNIRREIVILLYPPLCNLLYILFIFRVESFDIVFIILVG